MTLIVVLIVVAFVLIAAEVFMPGGILGIFAIVFLLGATVIAYQEMGAPGAILTGTASILGGILVFIATLQLLSRTKLGKGFRLDAKVSGKAVGNNLSSDLIGRVGSTVTKLVPNGLIAVDGNQYPAHSEDGYADLDTPVIITSIRGAFFNVRIHKQNSTSS